MLYIYLNIPDDLSKQKTSQKNTNVKKFEKLLKVQYLILS